MELLCKVRANIEHCRMVKQGDKVVVAVSGGPDSVVLLHLLYQLRDELGISLHVAHLNHMFRGAESEADAFFVAGAAKQYQLPVTVEAIDVPAYRDERRLPAQVAAREVRYRFLKRVAGDVGATRVALAHQADDQAETILINFLRGSGTSGLKGIPPVRENFYIRPLLTVRRSEIERYCAEMRLSFRRDSSNFKPVYVRNRVRMQLLPLLESDYNSDMVSNLLRLGEISREEDDYLERQAAQAYREALQVAAGGRIGLSLGRMREMPQAIRRRVLRLAWLALTGSKRDLSFEHTRTALNLLGNGITGSSAALPAGIVATRSYDTLELRASQRKPSVGNYIYPLKIPGATYIPELDQTVYGSVITGEAAPDPRSLPVSEALLDFEKLPPQIFIRRRREGDVFRPFGKNSAIKLKDFLIKQKVPREERDYLPIISTPEEIIWVGGVRVGENWKIGGNTTKMLHLIIARGAPA
ncbi:MAG: tRNA(Ile)-lysidine synthase [Pelotomaculum sp. PtaU1.Bin035]|nr:MAG: tRNA(Ile)-lysidine synthase [Pelotomaculum sp. PtaU1.Bin035]